MKFKGRLLQGALIKRYKRFFVDIEYKNKIITCHCPNSGSMMGLLNKGNKVWFSTSDNPYRKLKYTLEIIEVKKKLVGINTLLTNKIVYEALNLKKINNLAKFNNIKSEVKFSENTRFDFLLNNNNEKCKSGADQKIRCREIVAWTYCLQEFMFTETYQDFRHSVSTPGNPGGKLTE